MPFGASLRLESGGPNYRLFRPLVVSEMARFTRHSPPFGPSITVPGLAYLFLRLSAYGVPQYPRRLGDLLSLVPISATRSGGIASSSVTFCDLSQISRGKFGCLFDAQLPALPAVRLMDMGFVILCLFARHRRASYPVLVHRLAPLRHASFGPRLTASVISPLRFAMTSPPSGCQGEFAPPAVEPVRHTSTSSGLLGRAFFGFRDTPSRRLFRSMTATDSPRDISRRPGVCESDAAPATLLECMVPGMA